MQRVLAPRCSRSALVLAALLAAGAGAGTARATPVRPAPSSSGLVLASRGATSYVIAIPANAGEVEAFAASELASYLGRLSGASFAVTRDAAPAQAIVLRIGGGAGAGGGDTRPGEGYTIAVRERQLLLTGESPRAVLYAAYDLLERLGCRWLAPELDFYGGAAEVVPRRERLVYSAGDVATRPVLAYRKIDVENGRSHDAASLRRIIAWMPKLRYNTLQVPLDYAGHGRVVWDHWRDELTPELKRRGLLLEVGGHGYQNFISAGERGGALFREHPEWFGRDAECRRSADERVVFDTENEGAVAHLVDAVVGYVRAHPEIDILDFWPPDGARWSLCAADRAGPPPEDRQARLVARLHEELKRVRPELRLEIIAYGEMKLPPRRPLPADVLVDFCPIGQSFDVPIHDGSASNNAQYVRAIRAWRTSFPGELSLYSYYRKYAWRSLPIVLPHYLGQDLRWYAREGLRGISTYAEPADWGTYEVNHYMLGKLAWNPAANVDALLGAYGRARYGASWPEAGAALGALEDRYRRYASVPYSAADPAAAIGKARAELVRRRSRLDGALNAAGPARPTLAALDRLALMLEYAIQDLGILQDRAGRRPPAEIRPRVEALVRMLEFNAGQGVFLLQKGQLDVMLKHYQLDGAAPVPPAAPPAEAPL